MHCHSPVDVLLLGKTRRFCTASGRGCWDRILASQPSACQCSEELEWFNNTHGKSFKSDIWGLDLFPPHQRGIWSSYDGETDNCDSEPRSSPKAYIQGILRGSHRTSLGCNGLIVAGTLKESRPGKDTLEEHSASRPCRETILEARSRGPSLVLFWM